MAQEKIEITKFEHSKTFEQWRETYLHLGKTHGNVALLPGNLSEVFCSDGFVTVLRKREKNFKHYHFKSGIELTELLQYTLHYSYYVDVYMSQNTFYKPKRSSETIRQLRNLYIDIDLKDKPGDLKTNKQKTLDRLKNHYFGKKVPLPSLIIDSGRGLHLVWNIEPVPYQALPLWQAVERYLYEKLKTVGADPACLDCTRVLRVAGSVNSKNGQMVKILETQDVKYELREIQQDYLPPLKPNKKKGKAKKGGRPPKIRQLYNLYTLYFARMQDLFKLCEVREWNLTGYREKIVFLYRYWDCCFSRDTELALENALELNKRFSNPLSENEVIKATKSAEKTYLDINKEYKYKNETLIDWLEITPEEQWELQTIIGKEEKYRRNNERRNERRRNKEGLTARQQKKQEKINTVLELKNKGYKQIEIAEVVGITERYVSQIINENRN